MSTGSAPGCGRRRRRCAREAETDPGAGYDAEEYIRLLELATAEVLNT